MIETCKECHQPRPSRHLSSPTKSYQTFEDFLDTVYYADGQLKNIKEESLEIIKKAYDDGKDLDNDFDEKELAEALDNYSFIRLIEKARGTEII